jgi:4-amino-4-deoxy-L-arabinose transferase-like glycosyltransferase
MDSPTIKKKISSMADLSCLTTMTSAGLIGILALIFYLRLLFFGQYIDGDVGNAGYVAWRMAEGEVLIDLEGPGKPPLYPMLYALFIRLFGTTVLGLKMFGTFFVLMAVVAVYWLAKQAYGKQVGLLAALLFGIFSSAPMVEGETVNLETIMHLPSILAIGLILKGSISGKDRWYFLAGTCAALATLVKQVGGVLFAVFLCYGIHKWLETTSLRKKWFYRYVLLGGGAILPLVGITIFYHVHGYTLRELYDSLLGSNFRYLQRGYEYASSLKNFSMMMRVILPENGLIWLGTIFASTYLVWRILRDKGQKSDLILLWWALWSFAALWISRTFFWHYFLQIVAPFSVLTAYGIITSWKLVQFLSPLSKLVLRGVWVIILGILTFVFIKTDYKYFFSYSPIDQTICQHKLSDGVFDEYGVYNIVQHEIASYIRAQTDPAETIYVWGIAPQIYFLAQRKAATRYRNNYNLSELVTDKPLEALKAYAPTVIENIRRSPPSYIVQIFRLEDFPELQTFVRDHYTLDRNMEFPVPPHKICLYQRQPNFHGVPDLK